jgi:hypothetical protein
MTMARMANAWRGLEALEPRQLLTSVFWDGGGGDGSWDNPLNWSNDQLPGAADSVLIDAPGHPTIHRDQNTSATVASLQSLDPISISAGTLTVTGSWRQSGALTVSGGRIGGAANLQLNGDLLWTGGEIAGGAAKLQVLPGRTVTIDGDVTLSRALVNNGAVVWQSGNITASGATIYNLDERTFLIHSAGTLVDGAVASRFINRGTLALDGTPGATTTIAVLFDNQQNAAITTPATNPGVPSSLFMILSGIVDDRSGTLAFTGTVAQKNGTSLDTGRWFVGNDGQLILPGPAIDHAGAVFKLSGPNSSFPQLEGASFVNALTLADGRTLTLSNPNLLLSMLTIVNSSMTLHRPVAWLSVVGGNVTVDAGAVTTRLYVGDGATVTLTGTSSVGDGGISGPGLLRVAGRLIWTQGLISGPGQMLILPSGTLQISDREQTLVFIAPRVLTRRLVNYGTITWDDQGDVPISGELVNRGTMNILHRGFLSTAGTPAYLWNFGTITSAYDLTLRGAGGGVYFYNGGDVRAIGGSLVLNGGVGGGGTWYAGSGAEIAFGGLADSLSGAVFSGPGRLRIANTSAWTNVSVQDFGEFVVTPYGHLTLGGGSNQIGIGRGVTNNGEVALAGGASWQVFGNVRNNGTLRLGAGSLHIGGALTEGTAATLEVLSTGPGAGGSVEVQGFATLAGTLRTDFAWVPPLGTVFNFLTTPTHSGAFASVVSSPLALGQGVRFDFVGSVGGVTVIAV